MSRPPPAVARDAARQEEGRDPARPIAPRAVDLVRLLGRAYGNVGASWILLSMAVVVVACSSPSLVVHNRSERTLAIGPGLSIAPCSTRTVSVVDFEAAREKGLDLEAGSPAWPVPADAVVWNNLSIQGSRGNGTLTIIVSSTEAPRVITGAVPDLPACAGDPVL